MQNGYTHFALKQTTCKENFINKEPLTISEDKISLIKALIVFQLSFRSHRGSTERSIEH